MSEEPTVDDTDIDITWLSAALSQTAHARGMGSQPTSLETRLREIATDAGPVIAPGLDIVLPSTPVSFAGDLSSTSHGEEQDHD